MMEKEKYRMKNANKLFMNPVEQSLFYLNIQWIFEDPMARSAPSLSLFAPTIITEIQSQFITYLLILQEAQRAGVVVVGRKANQTNIVQVMSKWPLFSQVSVKASLATLPTEQRRILYIQLMQIHQLQYSPRPLFVTKFEIP